MKYPWISTLLACASVHGAAAQDPQHIDAAPAAREARDPGSPAGPVVRVSGNRLVDGAGHTLQLRGVNVSGLEFYPILNAADQDYWGGQTPKLRAIQAWHANAIRVPLNEQSYLQQTCFQPRAPGSKPSAQSADPLKKYRTLVRALVDDATHQGMYVILDLHKNAPAAVIAGSDTALQICSISSAQQEMADAANSVAFWRAVASDYRDYPNVIFDLFNEPHIDNFIAPAGAADAVGGVWTVLRDGGVGKLLYGNNQAITQNWNSAGMQALLDAVRSTGAANVVMAAGLSWSQDNSQWLRFAPVDPRKQLALSWHAYPKFGAEFGTAAYNEPGLGMVAYRWAEAILNSGYPIIIGETGDHSAAGTQTAPFLAILLPWADAHSVSVLGWGWNAWGAPSANLIKDASGTPTDGYGQAFRSWMLNHR